jgi:hypothetical protein
MYNQVTDRFGMVQTEIVKVIPILGRTITAVNGYSIEVFRSDVHRGSVRTRDSREANNTGPECLRMKVSNGDTIFRVSLGPRTVPVVGNLTTKDRFIRPYDVAIDLIVCNPVLFVHGYRLGKDPMNLAIERFKSGFQKYASNTESDKLYNFKRPLDTWNNSLCEYTGIKLIQISQWNLGDDPKREELSALQQEAEKNAFSIMIGAEIQKLEDRIERERSKEKREHEHSEQRIQKDFEREDDTLQQMHTLRKILRDTAAQEFTDILRERIRETFEGGKSINEVAEDSLKLLDAFHESLLRGNVVDSTLSSGPKVSLNSTSSDTDTISSDDDTTIEHDVKTDPLNVPANMSDLSDTGQKEADEE